MPGCACVRWRNPSFMPRPISPNQVLAMLGVAAKLDRRRILELRARGRADAEAKGVKFGRKPTLALHHQREARARIDAGEAPRSVARSCNVNQATISRLVV